MGRTWWMQVAGPLAGYAAGFEAELARLGYSRFTAEAELRLMAHVSAWLDGEGLEAGQLTTERTREYLVYRRASGHVRRLTPRGLQPLVAYLRGIGAIPAATVAVAVTAADLLLAEFEQYLTADRGLAARTIEGYRRVARAFLADRCSPAVDDLRLESLAAADVSSFMLEQSALRGAGSLGNVVTALRALLGFLYLRQHTPLSLAAAVPAVCPARRAAVSRSLSAGDVARLLGSCDRRTTAGRRDYAIVIVLARLGLRAGEVAALLLDDVDWRAGELVVTGKGGRRERLPLPVDVGLALAGYLQRGRRRGECRHVFLHVRAPYRAGALECQSRRGAGLPARRAAGEPRARAASQCRDRDGQGGSRADRDRPGAAPPPHRNDRDLRHDRPAVADLPCAAVAGGGCVMSDLRRAVEDYLTIRRALGFKLRGHDRLLGDLVADLERAGAPTITTELALAWATKPTGTHPFWHKTRLQTARGFARYLQTIDPATQVPPTGLLAYRRARPAPYLYSDVEIQALLAATDALRPVLRAATYRTLLGLLSVTGMRISEAIALDRDDVDLHAGQLTIREAKRGTRRLALHPSTVKALDDYARRRDQLCPAPKTPSFFVSTVGTRPIYACARATFTRLRRAAGLERSPGRSPRLHDLRHSFAVATLLDWHRAGLDVGARLPLLSAWLGHAHPASTYYYLQAAPELLALAAERLPDIGGRS